MTFNDAIVNFTSKFPELTVTLVIDYDKDHFVIEALKNIGVADYNSPYYGVDKRNGNVTSFIPQLDLDAFFEAVDNRTVYSIR